MLHFRKGLKLQKRISFIMYLNFLNFSYLFQLTVCFGYKFHNVKVHNFYNYPRIHFCWMQEEIDFHGSKLLKTFRRGNYKIENIVFVHMHSFDRSNILWWFRNLLTKIHLHNRQMSTVLCIIIFFAHMI